MKKKKDNPLIIFKAVINSNEGDLCDFFFLGYIF